MRELLAKWVAGLTGLAVCGMAVLFALIQNAHPGEKTAAIVIPMELPQLRGDIPSSLMQERVDLELGRVLFHSLGCGSCHQAGGVGNPRSPLDGVAGLLDREEMRFWIVSPEKMDPSIVKPDYSYLSQQQVDLLVGYLTSLK